jgi:oxygen-independent coproporphyrinogen III oxidase
MSLSFYIHIPFCRAFCSYCDFLRTRWNKTDANRYLHDLLRETDNARNEPAGKPSNCHSIYFGGGTPSLYNAEEISRIFNALGEIAPPVEHAEITIECNPGTVDRKRLAAYHKAGINRVSFGIQSFDPATLETLGRIHSADDAREIIGTARKAEFENVSADLIFGLPGQTLASWKADLDTMLQLSPDHISLYSLMLEGGTPMKRDVELGRLLLPPDDATGEMFETCIDTLSTAGYIQYEISNFARPGFESQHNLRYWDGGAYRGFGVGAHSFDGRKRWWNVGELDRYHRAVSAGKAPVENAETLTNEQRLTEGIMLSLRLPEGLDLGRLRTSLSDVQQSALTAAIDGLPGDLATCSANNVSLTRKGWLVADSVIGKLTEAVTGG